MTEKKSIYELLQNESTVIETFGFDYPTKWKVTRVPSGWIYEEFNTNLRITPMCVFVPFNNEFQNPIK